MATTLDELATPAPVVDLDRLERNLDRMAAYASEHRLSLRPHIKTHKSPVVAEQQLSRGAVGLTCATLREAEEMATVSRDLLLAYAPIGRDRLERAVALPADVTLTVAVDSPAAIAGLAAAARDAGRTVRVLIELDLGMRRVGVPTVEGAIALAREATDTAGITYTGICFYPGQVRGPIADDDPAFRQLAEQVERATTALDRAGLTPGIVSGGSTPTGWRTHEIPRLTEFRPGTYVYNDRTTVASGACTPNDCALTVLATVISTAVPGQVVIDAGTKSLGREPVRGAHAEGFGSVLGHPDVLVTRMWEEHGVLEFATDAWRPVVGDRVRIVPNHVCIVTHLFDTVAGVRGDAVERTWQVAARGRARREAAAPASEIDR